MERCYHVLAFSLPRTSAASVLASADLTALKNDPSACPYMIGKKALLHGNNRHQMRSPGTALSIGDGDVAPIAFYNKQQNAVDILQKLNEAFPFVPMIT